MTRDVGGESSAARSGGERTSRSGGGVWMFELNMDMLVVKCWEILLMVCVVGGGGLDWCVGVLKNKLLSSEAMFEKTSSSRSLFEKLLLVGGGVLNEGSVVVIGICGCGGGICSCEVGLKLGGRLRCCCGCCCGCLNKFVIGICVV